MITNQPYVSIAQYAKMTCYAYRTVFAKVQEGKIEGVFRIGREWALPNPDMVITVRPRVEEEAVA